MKKSEFSKVEVLLVLFICIGLIGGCVLLGISLIYGFGLGILLSSIVFVKKGFKTLELLNMILKGLWECRLLFALILMIGATVAIWLASGVVPAMIYYGFEYMKGMNFLFTAFLIIALSSVFMGTAVGTVSTIGVAILGIGRGFGIPDNILLGVIVSGAFIADKISPISGLLNLMLASTDTKHRDIFKSMLKTLIPTIIITAVIYYIIGTRYIVGNDTSKILEFQAAIRNGFLISPYLLLIPALIVIMSFSGVKIIYSILTGLFCGTLVSCIFQKMSVSGILNSILFGYRGCTSSEKLNEILKSGGVASMIEVVVIVAGAIALSSMLEGTGIIGYVTERIIDRIKSKGELVLKTAFISSILTVVTCDQTMGIVLPGRLLREKYNNLGLSRNVLARTISDTGIIIAPLMPWNINSLIIGLITGITAAGYAPWAVLCYISLLITFIYGFMNTNFARGFLIRNRNMKEEKV